jgi:hypothetical protein
MNNESFWCMDCAQPRDLDIHGRCGCCESEAVIAASQNQFFNRQGRKLSGNRDALAQP